MRLIGKSVTFGKNKYSCKKERKKTNIIGFHQRRIKILSFVFTDEYVEFEQNHNFDCSS